MQKKFMVRATLSGNSGEKMWFRLEKVSGRGKICFQTPEILESGVSEAIFSV